MLTHHNIFHLSYRISNYCKFNCPYCFTKSDIPLTFNVERFFPFLDILFSSIKKDHPKFDIKIMKVVMIGGELTHLPFDQVYQHYKRLFMWGKDNGIIPSFGIVTVMDQEDKRWDDYFENIYWSNMEILKQLKFIKGFNRDIFGDKGVMITLSKYTYSDRVKRNIHTFINRTEKYTGGKIYFTYIDRGDQESIDELDQILSDLKPGPRAYLVVSNIKEFDCGKTTNISHKRMELYEALAKKHGCYVGKNHHLHAGYMKHTRIIPENNYLAINEYGEITPCIYFNSNLKQYTYYDEIAPVPNIATVKSYDEISNSKFFKWFNDRILENICIPVCPLDKYFREHTPDEVRKDINEIDELLPLNEDTIGLYIKKYQNEINTRCSI